MFIRNNDHFLLLNETKRKYISLGPAMWDLNTEIQDIAIW